MEAEGATVVKNYRETAFMGLFEVLAHARTIARNTKHSPRRSPDHADDDPYRVDRNRPD